MDSATTAAALRERADAIASDIQANHLPRIVQSLTTNYIDENQALLVYDHLVRIRVLREAAELLMPQ